MASSFRFHVYPSTPQGLGEILKDADLVYVGASRVGDGDPGLLLQGLLRVLHPRGNLLLLGRFPALATFYPHLRSWIVEELVLPTHPLPGPTPPLQAHRLALLAWKPPSHIARIPYRYRAGLYQGGTTLVAPSPHEPSPLGEGELEALYLAHAASTFAVAPAPFASLALLVERYSEEAGLVVAVGWGREAFALTAHALGRRVALSGESLEEARSLLALPALYREALSQVEARGQRPVPRKGR